MEPWIWSAAAVIITVLNILISRAVAIGSFRAQNKRLIEDVKKLTEEVSRIMPEFKSHIYISDGPKKGAQIYMSRVDCTQLHTLCNTQMFSRMEKLEESVCRKVDGLLSKQDQARKETEETLRRIFEFVGEVRQYIRDNQKQA